RGTGWAAAGLLAATVGVTLVDPAPVRCPSAAPVAMASATRTHASSASPSAATRSTCPLSHTASAAPVRTVASAAPVSAPETFQLATPTEETVPTAPEADTESDASDAESAEPDLVVHAVRSGEPPSPSGFGFGFVQASNRHKRDGGDWYSRGMG